MTRNARADVGLLASQMANRMDRFMWERYQQVQVLAADFHTVNNYEGIQFVVFIIVWWCSYVMATKVFKNPIFLVTKLH